MLYNGVELPDIEGSLNGARWDKVSYPYAWLSGDANSCTVTFSSVPLVFTGNYCQVQTDGKFEGYSTYKVSADRVIWSFSGSGTISSSSFFIPPFWTNTDILNIDGSVYLAATAPVYPNTPTPIAGNMEIVSVHPLDDSVSVICAVDSLSDTSPTFDFRYTLSSGGVEVRTGTSEETFTGIDNKFFFLTMPSLTPETEYTLSMSLYADGEDTGISASETFITLAAEEETPVDDTETLSLLSAILSAIKTQTDEQENQAYGILDMLGMMWLRLRYIEENTAALAPSKEETAIKEATKETTQAVVDEVFAEDAPTKVTASDVKDVAEIGSAASSMFDSGVSVSSFFDAINDISLIALFTEKSKNDIYAVNEIATYGIDSGNQVVDYYTENLNKIKEFVGGDG